MYAYCSNNPVVRKDDGGEFWDIVFDVVSLVVSVVEVVKDPSDPLNWVGLAGDVLDVAIPCVAGVGESIKAFSTANKIADGIDDVHDAAKMADNIGDAVDTVSDTTRKIDFYITPNGEAIPTSLEGFNSNLSRLDVQNGKYVGMDSKGPVRIRTNEIHSSNPNFTGTSNPLHTQHHFHIDRRINGDTGAWKSTFIGSMEIFR